MSTINITPDTNVLIALTHTPLLPIDALCELIDNSLDSFESARRSGVPIAQPIISITLPRESDLRIGNGELIVRDNGHGMDASAAENALRAGYSSNNPYDNLGLFGMGFNIATGKLGRRTVITTTRASDSHGIRIDVDLESVARKRSFDLEVLECAKPFDTPQGTELRISCWWPEGTPNSNFVKRLINQGAKKIRSALGRRYATLLQSRNVTILLNDQPIQAFQHCVWAPTRYVEKRSGRIYAQISFNTVLAEQQRCITCHRPVLPPSLSCDAEDCASKGIRTIEHRVRGWLGVQRYDHPTEFGIDLIRNGRAIITNEQDAFFLFTDELKATIKDYPIDGPYGRIVGEVHLDHVPVDFMKQDFQRTSSEWIEAMQFLRGNSSLQPTREGANENHSPMYRLYQGYRKVRDIGVGDLYPGKWDETEGKAKRITREMEKELYDRFVANEHGYRDDSKWYELVESATRRPTPELATCPHCHAENPAHFEACAACDKVLIGKPCIASTCGQLILRSAASCQHCGASQVSDDDAPWSCSVCSAVNAGTQDACHSCQSLRGTPHPLDADHLRAHSDPSAALSAADLTITLANGEPSTPLTIAVFITRGPLAVPPSQLRIPLHTHRTPRELTIFLDATHHLFRALHLRPEPFIAFEAAMQIFESNRSLATSGNAGRHTPAAIAASIISKRWEAELEDGPERVRLDALTFLGNLRSALYGVLAGNYHEAYDTLSNAQVQAMATNMIAQGHNITELNRSDGHFLNFVDNSALVSLFDAFTRAFFDNAYWKSPWGLPELPQDVAENLRRVQAARFRNCLEDLTHFVAIQHHDNISTMRARASLAFLQRDVAHP